jgi:hypothetical protein
MDNAITLEQLNQVKVALDIYQAQYTATDRLWSYFSTVTLGVVGFSIASDKVGKSLAECWVVAVAYLVFCIGNYMALELSQQMLVQFAELARTVARNNKLDLPTVQSLPAAQVMYFHIAIALMVASGIVGVGWWRRRKARQDNWS